VRSPTGSAAGIFTALSLAVIAPLLLLASVETYPTLLVGALFLGVSGASFAVGIPFVNAWFPPARRGTALGIYGMGNLGTAIAAFTTQPIAALTSRTGVFLTVAVVMVATAAVTWTSGRDAPTWEPQLLPMSARLRTALRLRVTLDLAALYAITFGGFVAFGVYLPTYLQEIYALESPMPPPAPAASSCSRRSHVRSAASSRTGSTRLACWRPRSPSWARAPS
jgi:MFS transporter, NNP family, nitrate/nitrite transporter